MDDLKVWIVPAISFCCFIVFVSLYFLYSIGEIKISRGTYAEVVQQNQGVATIEEFQKAMNSSIK